MKKDSTVHTCVRTCTIPQVHANSPASLKDGPSGAKIERAFHGCVMCVGACVRLALSQFSVPLHPKIKVYIGVCFFLGVTQTRTLNSVYCSVSGSAEVEEASAGGEDSSAEGEAFGNAAEERKETPN